MVPLEPVNAPLPIPRAPGVRRERRRRDDEQPRHDDATGEPERSDGGHGDAVQERPDSGGHEDDQHRIDEYV